MEHSVIFLSICLTLPTSSLSVISGITINPHSMPYVVALHIKGNTSRTLCGGTLVSKNYILTAASCTQNVDSIEAVLGAHYLNKKEKTQVHKVVNNTNFKIHPHYNESTLENDIALLKLPKPVKLNENVNVIKIATELDVENLNMTGGNEDIIDALKNQNDLDIDARTTFVVLRKYKQKNSDNKFNIIC